MICHVTVISLMNKKYIQAVDVNIKAVTLNSAKNRSDFHEEV